MVVALPSDDKPDITLRQPNVGRLAASLRRASRERRFVTVILNSRVDGMDLEVRGRFSFLGGDPKDLRRYAKRCLQGLAKQRASDEADVKSATAPEHVKARTAATALVELDNPDPRTNRLAVWTDGIRYYVQQWSVRFEVGVEHLPVEARDEWWACAEFDADEFAALRRDYHQELLSALRDLKSVVASREDGGLRVLRVDAVSERPQLRWCKVDDDVRKQIEERVARLRVPVGTDGDAKEAVRRMLLGERVSMTRALREDPDGTEPSDA